METATVDLQKTTLNFPDVLRRELKQAALDDDTTMTAIILEACRVWLEKRKKTRTK
jgi:hypothetical protein